MKASNNVYPSHKQRLQKLIHSRIRSRAVELGYDPARIEPVYDGVADWGAYLSASRKICWVLKEPYDEVDASGNPAGGGWTMFRDFGEGKTLASSANANQTLRNVAYASWGLLEGKTRDDDIPWIRDQPAVADALLRVCYLNTGKMPAATSTSDAQLRKIHGEWRDIVLDQIRLADLNLLIFAGTLRVWAEDLGLDTTRPLHKIVRGTCTVDIHEWCGRRVLWTDHPAVPKPRANWIDSILEAAE